MRKFIVIAACLGLFAASSVKAQTPRLMVNPENFSGKADTISNADTVYFESGAINAGAGKTLVVTVNADKVSGTVNTVFALQFCSDAENVPVWHDVDTGVAANLTLSNASGFVVWEVPNKHWKYRIVARQTGTQKVRVRCWQFLKGS